MNKRRADPFAALQADVAQIKDQVELLVRLAVGKAPRDPSIAGFCRRKGISRGLYIKLRNAGKGPRESAAGVRRIISPEAEADWDKEREAEAVALRRQATKKETARPSP